MFTLVTVPGTPYDLAAQRWEGRGPCIVYLHGLGCAASRDWPPVAQSPALAGRASLAIDLLGFGRSPRPSGFSYDLHAQAELLVSLLRAEQRVALVGHSMGGTLAVLLAERLIAEGRPPEAVVLAEPNLRPEDATFSARVASTPLERFLAEWPRWIEKADTPWSRAGLEASDPTALHRSSVSLVSTSPRVLPRFGVLPVAHKGYLLGEKSDAVTAETARLVRALGVPVVSVAGSGHAFSSDAPAAFGAAIATLLEGP
jgi:pimeloyl-ACP methyl ester carboxylesterase